MRYTRVQGVCCHSHGAQEHGMARLLSPAACDVFAIFEDLCLLGNTKCPQFLQLEYPHKMFTLELIERLLMNYH